MGGLSMTTPTPFTIRCSMLTQWRMTPTTPAGGFSWTSPKTRHGLMKLMDLTDQFIAEFCTLDPDKVPPILSPECSIMTSSKSLTLTTPPTMLSTNWSTDLWMKDFKLMCTNSESYTMSRIPCLPPSSTLTIRSMPTRRKRSSLPTFSSKPEQCHALDLMSLGVLNISKKKLVLFLLIPFLPPK